MRSARSTAADASTFGRWASGHHGDRAVHPVGVVARQMARELPCGRELVREGERGLDRLACWYGDLAGPGAVRGLGSVLVDLLHLGVADQELVVDPIGVRDDETYGLAGRDPQRREVEMREVDRH